jgi:CHASE2 domain-containing sensor protein
LDDDSLDDLRKPMVYIRPELAELVRFLKRQGAAEIGLDLILPESMTGFEGL